MGWFKKAVSKVKKAGKKVRKTRATIRKAVKKTASRVVKKAVSRVVKKAVSRAPSRPSVSRPPTRPSVYHAHSRPSVSRPPTRPSVYHAHSRPSVSRPYTPTDAIISPIITPSRITKIIQQRRKVGISAPPRITQQRREVGISAPPRITRREIPPTPIRKPTPLKTEIYKPKKIMYGEIRKEEKQKGVSRISQILSEQISRTIDKIPREKSENKKMSLRAKLTALETLKVVPDVVVGLWSLATLPPKIALLSVSKEGRKQLKENLFTLPKEIQRSLEAEGKTAKLNPSQTAGRLVGLMGRAALLTKGLSKVGKLSGTVTMKFIGTQKIKGKKLITNIAFESGGKRIGIAKGVTRTKGKNSISTVIGRSGIRGVKFPTGKIKLGRKTVFFGKEISKAKPTTFLTEEKIKLALKGTKLIKIKKNIKGLKQLGIGKVYQIKGDTFVRAGKLKTGIKKDDFVSISAIFTKKDLSRIIGRTITAKGDKVKFIGMIKGIKSTPKFTTNIQKFQYTKALQKVVSVAAAAASQGKKAVGLSKLAQLAVSAGAIQNIIAKKTPSKLKQRITTKLKQKIIPIQETKLKPLQKQITTQINIIKEKTRQLNKQISQTKLKPLKKLLEKQKVGLFQKLTSLQLQGVKLSARFGIVKPIIKITKFPLVPPPLISKRKKKKRRVRRRPKKKIGYKPFVKSKGKFRSVNKKPLSKTRAKDRGSFVTDRTVSATFKIKGVGRKKKLGNLPKKQRGYFSRTRRKFKGYKIVKKKRVQLKNKFIERRKARIDTRGEKRGLTVARLLKQERKSIKRKIRKPIRRKIVRRTFSRKVFKPKIHYKRKVFKRTISHKRKKTLSQSQLSTLASGRAKRMANLKKRK